MLEEKITVGVRQISTKVGIMDIQGDVSASAEKALMNAYAQIDQINTRTIILNFTQMGYMNSSGIGLLVTLLIRVNRQKQQLRAYGLSEHYQHIFKLTRLSDAIHLYDTEHDALTAEQTR